VVSFGDGGDDGQVQPEAVGVGGTGGGEPLERFQQPGHLIGGDDRAGVGDRQPGAAVCGGDLDVGLAAWDVVLDGVVDQVGGQSLQQPGVAEDGGGADGGAVVNLSHNSRIPGSLSPCTARTRLA
jgi:hypothetical protein